MELNAASFADTVPVDAYGPGFFRVGGAVHTGALLLLPEGVRSWSGFDDREPLMAAAGEVDVVFLGTGADIAPLPADLRSGLEATGVGVEHMATAPACRTYNVLLAEGRRVALAAQPV